MTFSPSLVSCDPDNADGQPSVNSAFPTLSDDVRRTASRIGFPPTANISEHARDSTTLRMVRDWVADLQNAILNSDLSDVAEFHALFAVMVGLGLSQRELARSLCLEYNTINRYANGNSSPSGLSNRRGVLLETYRVLQSKLNDGSLEILKLYQRPDALEG